MKHVFEKTNLRVWSIIFLRRVRWATSVVLEKGIFHVTTSRKLKFIMKNLLHMQNTSFKTVGLIIGYYYILKFWKTEFWEILGLEIVVFCLFCCTFTTTSNFRVSINIWSSISLWQYQIHSGLELSYWQAAAWKFLNPSRSTRVIQFWFFKIRIEGTRPPIWVHSVHVDPMIFLVRVPSIAQNQTKNLKMDKSVLP